MGLGVSQPPALLKALAQRAERGEVEDLNLYYLLSTAIAGDTVLRYELMDRIRPWSLFHSAVERRLEQRAFEEGRPSPVQFIPTGFQQSPRSARSARAFSRAGGWDTPRPMAILAPDRIRAAAWSGVFSRSA